MTLPLTPEMLIGAYEFLRTTPPFFRWKLPDPDDVEFRVGTEKDCYGWHNHRDGMNHCIAISIRNVGHTGTLMDVMAHEMIHLFQAIRGTETPGNDHNAEFKRRARQVCRHHGFDPKAF